MMSLALTSKGKQSNNFNASSAIRYNYSYSLCFYISMHKPSDKIVGTKALQLFFGHKFIGR